jgi:hypothetical protein
MPKKEAPLHHLNDFLPPGTLENVLKYLTVYKIHLTITRERKTILGDYRHRTQNNNHRISINGNLNVYSFLITLVHEIAHLLTFEQYGNKVAAHGKEWKKIYALLLTRFLDNHTFPADIESTLKKAMENPAASSCAEDGLVRVLRLYDKNPNGYKLVEEIPVNGLFRLDDGRIFKRGEQLRKRIKCKETATGRDYLFSPVYEVEMLEGNK